MRLIEFSMGMGKVGREDLGPHTKPWIILRFRGLTKMPVTGGKPESIDWVPKTRKGSISRRK